MHFEFFETQWLRATIFSVLFFYDYMLSRSKSPGNFRLAAAGSRRSRASSGGSRSVLCAWREIAEASLVHPLALGAREIPRCGGHDGARSSEAAA